MNTDSIATKPNSLGAKMRASTMEIPNSSPWRPASWIKLQESALIVRFLSDSSITIRFTLGPQ